MPNRNARRARAREGQIVAARSRARETALTDARRRRRYGKRRQAVHTPDVAEAYRAAIVSDASGAFNIAAEPVLDAKLLAQLLAAKLVPIPAAVARGVVSLLWRLHAVPISAAWLDLALNVPLLDTSRAREVLGWSPRKRADDALRELVRGMREGVGAETPPLSPHTSGPLRVRELVTGVGRRSGA